MVAFRVTTLVFPTNYVMSCILTISRNTQLYIHRCWTTKTSHICYVLILRTGTVCPASCHCCRIAQPPPNGTCDMWMGKMDMDMDVDVDERQKIQNVRWPGRREWVNACSCFAVFRKCMRTGDTYLPISEMKCFVSMCVRAGCIVFDYHFDLHCWCRACTKHDITICNSKEIVNIQLHCIRANGKWIEKRGMGTGIENETGRIGDEWVEGILRFWNINSNAR